MTADSFVATNGTAARTGTNSDAVAGPKGPRPKRITIGRIGIYAFLLIMAAFFCLPLYVMLVTSFKTMPEVREAHLFNLPREWTIDPWIKAWTSACTGRECTGLSPGFLNSWKISIPAVIISIIVAQLNGYALSFWRYKGAEALFNLLVFGAFVPYQVLVYPIIIGLRDLHLFATLPGIIIVHTIFGMSILTLLYRNYYSSIPIEIFKASRIDGAGFWQTFFRVMLPLSIPITTVAVILQVTGIWNDFLFALVFAGKENIPMTLQLNNIVKTTFGTVEYNVNETILTALVPLIVYFVSGKWFVRGIAAGAVKGKNVESSVSIKDLSLNFGSVNVLQKLTLDIAQGEFLVLLGPSGCGKSTLLNCIAGLLDISEGQIFISGKNVTWEEPKDRGIGMVFQSYALYPQMTVERNLSFGLRVARMPADQIKERVQRASEILQLQPLLDRKPQQLSGGQRQRVAIGRALVRDVDVFLFDEPLSNLDAKLRGELRIEIKRLHQRLKNTMIYVTHDQIEAMTLADRIAIMKNGVIQQLDDPHTIYNKPVNLFVAGFIGSPGMNFINGKLSANSIVLDGVTVPLTGYAMQKAVDGSNIVLGVRPEHVAIGEDARKMPFTLESEIEIVEPMGADTVAWTKIGGQSLTFRAASEVHLAPGQKVLVGFDPARASVFDAASGMRV